MFNDNNPILSWPIAQLGISRKNTILIKPIIRHFTQTIIQFVSGQLHGFSRKNPILITPISRHFKKKKPILFRQKLGISRKEINTFQANNPIAKFVFRPILGISRKNSILIRPILGILRIENYSS